MEKREIISHQKIFRQINSLGTYLVKISLSRNFCQKCVRENSRNFHTVESMKCHFLQKIVKSTPIDFQRKQSFYIDQPKKIETKSVKK